MSERNGSRDHSTRVISVLERLNVRLMQGLKLLIVVLFTILIVLLSINVFCRYVLKNTLFWVTELSCYLLVYLIFCSAALALQRGEHISMSSVLDRLPKAVQELSRRFGSLLNYLFIVLMIWFGTIVAAKNFGSYTGTLPIPTGAVYAAAPVSGILMLLIQLEKTLKRRSR